MEERKCKEAEEWKRAEEEKKWKEEEIIKQLAIEKQQQSEMERRQGVGENEEDPMAEAEQKRRVEAWLYEKWTTEQMAQVAQAKSSKQVTQDFA